MRYFFVFILALIFLGILNASEENAKIDPQKEGTGKATEPGDSLKNPFIDKLSSSLQGKKIYDENCASCHGKKGLGNGQAGEELAPKPDNLTSKEIHKLSDGALFLGISDGAHGVMIPWKFMISEDQRWHLVDYIRELWENQNKGDKK